MRSFIFARVPGCYYKHKDMTICEGPVLRVLTKLPTRIKVQAQFKKPAKLDGWLEVKWDGRACGYVEWFEGHEYLTIETRKYMHKLGFKQGRNFWVKFTDITVIQNEN